VTFLEADFDEAATQASTIGNQHLYTGRERDAETGLQLNGHRFYAPHLGRWMQRDPLEYDDGFNSYQYVHGRPASLVDPFGLQAVVDPVEYLFALQRCMDRCKHYRIYGDDELYRKCIDRCWEIEKFSSVFPNLVGNIRGTLSHTERNLKMDYSALLTVVCKNGTVASRLSDEKWNLRGRPDEANSSVVVVQIGGGHRVDFSRTEKHSAITCPGNKRGIRWEIIVWVRWHETTIFGLQTPGVVTGGLPLHSHSDLVRQTAHRFEGTCCCDE
jgi:RHS repeat-associated protein